MNEDRNIAMGSPIFRASRPTSLPGEVRKPRRSLTSIKLNLVYQYRRIASRQLPDGSYTPGDRRRLRTIRSLFNATSAETVDTATPSFRQLGLLTATLREPDGGHPVTVVALGLDEMICFRGPDLADGATVELIADDAESGFSYRFKARVEWSYAHADNGQVLGLSLSGVPLLVRYGS